MVLVNGVGGVQAAFVLQVRDFSDRYRVVTYDHRGIGGSEPGPPGGTLSDYAEDLHRLITTLRGPNRGTAAVVVGMSFGGRVALLLAATRPESVSALVVCGASSGGPDDVLGDPAAREALLGTPTAEDWQHRIGPALFGPAYRRRYPRRMAALAKWRRRHPIDPAAIRAQAAALRGADLSGLVREIRAPTLVLHGEDDGLQPLENGRRLAAVIPGARLSVLRQVGHSPNVEAPGLMKAEIELFIAGLSN